MTFEYLQGEEASNLAITLNQAIPEGTSNRTTLGALGGVASAILSDLVTELGEEALIEILEDWTAEIATKALMIAKLQAEGFDFAAWALGGPTVGEA